MTINRWRKPAPASMLVNVPRLVSVYYADAPDPAIPDQKVAFGTSGHRGSSFLRSFNEAHILAITQAIVMYRTQQGIGGPLSWEGYSRAVGTGVYQCAGSPGRQRCDRDDSG